MGATRPPFRLTGAVLADVRFWTQAEAKSVVSDPVRPERLLRPTWHLGCGCDAARLKGFLLLLSVALADLEVRRCYRHPFWANRVRTISRLRGCGRSDPRRIGIRGDLAGPPLPHVGPIKQNMLRYHRFPLHYFLNYSSSSFSPSSPTSTMPKSPTYRSNSSA